MVIGANLDAVVIGTESGAKIYGAELVFLPGAQPSCLSLLPLLSPPSRVFSLPTSPLPHESVYWTLETLI